MSVTYRLTLDLAKETDNAVCGLKVGETGEKVFKIALNENGKAFQFDGESVQLHIKKPDNNIIISDATRVNNLCIFSISGENLKQLTAVAGECEAEMVVIVDNKVNKTCRFSIFVEKGVIDEEDIKSTSIYTDLLEARENLDSKENAIENKDDTINIDRDTIEGRTLIGVNDDKVILRDEYEHSIKPIINSKVTQEAGKGLSSNDYTDEEKARLKDMPNEAREYMVETAFNQQEGNPLQFADNSDGTRELTVHCDTELSETSDNPVANSVVYNELHKSYEVIETVTTEEEISVFTRSQEPDGTAYKFDRMRVLLEIPSAESTSGIIARMQKNSNANWVYYYTNSSGITTAKRYLSCEGYKSFGYWNSETLYGGGEYSLPTKTGQIPAFWQTSESKIPQIAYLYISGNLPVGTKITIMGVRA